MNRTVTIPQNNKFPRSYGGEIGRSDFCTSGRIGNESSALRRVLSGFSTDITCRQNYINRKRMKEMKEATNGSK